MSKAILRVLCSWFIVPIVFIGVIPAALAQPQTKILLASSAKVVENPYFEGVVQKRGDEGAYERAKIEYLIERIRASHLTFVRNREDHTSSEAANHLSMKWYRAGNLIKTARNFIRYIASASSFTGHPYLVKFRNGHTYPARDILTNELERLETLVARRSGKV